MVVKPIYGVITLVVGLALFAVGLAQAGSSWLLTPGLIVLAIAIGLILASVIERLPGESAAVSPGVFKPAGEPTAVERAYPPQQPDPVAPQQAVAAAPFPVGKLVWGLFWAALVILGIWYGLHLMNDCIEPSRLGRGEDWELWKYYCP